MKKRNLLWYAKILTCILAANIFLAGLYHYLVKPYLDGHPIDPINSARIAFARGDVSRAELLLRNILLSKPENVQAQVLLGSLCASTNRWSDAAVAYEKTLSLDPTNRDALEGFEISCRNLKQQDRAVTAWRRATQANSADPTLWKGLGYAQLRVDDSLGAMFSLRRSLKLDPNQNEVRRIFHEVSMAQMGQHGDPFAQRRQDLNNDPLIPNFPDSRGGVRIPENPNPLPRIPYPDGRIR